MKGFSFMKIFEKKGVVRFSKFASRRRKIIVEGSRFDCEFAGTSSPLIDRDRRFGLCAWF